MRTKSQWVVKKKIDLMDVFALGVVLGGPVILGTVLGWLAHRLTNKQEVDADDNS